MPILIDFFNIFIVGIAENIIELYFFAKAFPLHTVIRYKQFFRKFSACSPSCKIVN